VNPYYTEKPGVYPEKLPDLKPGEIRGHAWSAWPADGLYLFEFLEAMHGGRARKLAITEDDFNDLKNNPSKFLDYSYRDRPDFDAMDKKYADEINALGVTEIEKKNELFFKLVPEIGTLPLPEALWTVWGAASLEMLDAPLPEFNEHLRWWKFKQEKRTMRQLIKTTQGREEVWRFVMSTVMSTSRNPMI
jgi:hypothetical protein